MSSASPRDKGCTPESPAITSGSTATVAGSGGARASSASRASAWRAARSAAARSASCALARRAATPRAAVRERTRRRRPAAEAGAAASPPGLLLGGLFLNQRLGPHGADGLDPGLEGNFDVGEDSIALFRADQAAAHRIAHQLLGIVERELAYSRSGADRLHQGVGHGAAQYARDSGEGLEQRRDLRPAEFS